MRKKIVCAITIIALAGCGGNRNSKTAVDAIDSTASEKASVDAIDSTASEKAAPSLVAELLEKPYEATWMRLTETDSGYIVYNYPNIMSLEGARSPTIIAIKSNRLIWITNEDDIVFSFDNVEYHADSSYCFRVGNSFDFKLVDKEKHIAQWTTYTMNRTTGFTDYYIDSLHNTYPIVDWEDDDDEI